ncbi:cupin domain-containing protein [Acetobacter lambici]|uniref:Cupin domain-containing protein n=1 Tax=Acetobacter lambici TaxID=1332824 RepID=A0ABT1F2J4_9PROT|nr:cupin domain-containing protein [Acetobacter lambici]MCP1243420.1 cupin domain-containing protein [Acetobacter lambici]MCP1259429.1 cupin domain-containing protein [Acetobacter lambici]NHO57684.1 cupin domain-containing protein [Acetobacter lambici]
MKIFNLSEQAAGLSVIDIEKKTESVSKSGLQILFPFGKHDVGLLRFKGSTPWEEHPNDEFLLVVEGQTTLTLRTGDKETSATAKKGDVLVVPGKTWHRQDAQDAVTLMFMTNHDGNQHKAATD